eukprot:GHUV01026566.1.p1 GENE.GHUV01026566.1~~GHUV01026566.1.p1  ORF type:complete len:157 (+),score=49.00 GHUV01026566.1:205-675(+)
MQYAPFSSTNTPAVGVLPAPQQHCSKIAFPRQPHSAQRCSSSSNNSRHCHSNALHCTPGCDCQPLLASSCNLPLAVAHKRRIAAASSAGSDSGSPPDTPSTSGGTVSNPSTSNPSSSSTAQPGGLTRMLQQWNQNTKKLRQQLQSLGLAGVVAYGL